MFIFTSAVFGGFSCFGLMECFKYLGVGDYESGFLALIIITVLSVLQNVWRYR